MITLLKNFLFLFFPELCQVCGKPLLFSEKILCSGCISDIPKTRFHNFPDNKTSMLFWGRINFVKATSFFYYQKHCPYSFLLHKLKYRKKKEIGIELGEHFGVELKKSGFSADIDFLVPIPLHWKREKKRGYNQSEMIAIGISNVTGIPINTKLLFRHKHNLSQTTKNKKERWGNVEDIFTVSKIDTNGKHLLLIDDVVTTGSTIEASANCILKNKNVSLSIATLAIAVN